jgi:predicted nucleic acid-binding protein
LTEYVVDASALVLAVVGKTESASILRARMLGMVRHAPHLIDAEVGNVLRRHEHAGLVSGREADTALRVSGLLIDHRYPHVGALGQRAWALRHNMSYYDALYVALASYLHLPLLTGDARLSRAPGLPCRTEVV